MEFDDLPLSIKKNILKAQRNEITEFNVYNRLAKLERGKNAEVLKAIAKDELEHYKRWKAITGINIKSSGIKVFFTF